MKKSDEVVGALLEWRAEYFEEERKGKCVGLLVFDSEIKRMVH